MKRLSLVKPLTLMVVAGALLVSCASTSSQPSTNYAEGYSLFGEEAAAYYLALLEKEESHIFRYNYAYSLYEAEEYREALKEAEKGAGLYPEYIRFLYLALQAAEQLESTFDVIRLNEMILDLDPVNERAINSLISLYLKEGSIEKATNLAQEKIWNLKDQREALRALASTSSFYASLYQEKYPEAETYEE